MKEWVLVPETHSDELAAPASNEAHLSGRADRSLGPGEGELGQGRPPRALAARDHVRPGSGVDPHFHKGTATRSTSSRASSSSTSGDEVFRATPGSYVLAPPNVVHYFRNMGDTPARVLNLHTPGGFAPVPARARGAPRRRASEPDTAFFERHDVFDV